MVLSSRKPDPQVQDELVAANKFKDPILSSWQIGLGRVAVFTGDATRRWSAGWIASGQFEKFWTQLLRGVSRAPMSGDFDVQTVPDGSQTKLIVEALADRGAMNGLTIAGTAPALADLGLTATGDGLAGQTLSITSTGGGTATALTFGVQAGQISTLNGLNAALAANNLQATIDANTGKINITTTNDAASSTVGTLSGTAERRGLFGENVVFERISLDLERYGQGKLPGKPRYHDRSPLTRRPACRPGSRPTGVSRAAHKGRRWRRVPHAFLPRRSGPGR